MNKFIFLLIPFVFFPLKIKARGKKSPISFLVLGNRSTETIAQVGMWTYHFNDKKMNKYNWRNNPFSLEHNGYFVATLINSHGKRIHTAGLSRKWKEKSLHKHLQTGLGYRIGGIYGYGREFSELAVKFKILPFIQFFTYLTFDWFRVEISTMQGKLVSLSCGLNLKKF